MDGNLNLDVVGGPDFAKLMKRKDITEIYVNDDGRLWFQSARDGKKRTSIYMKPETVRAVIEYVTGEAGKVVNSEIPSISTEIRGYGYRFQGELPPIVRVPQFNIRKKATKIFTFDDYVKTGMMTSGYRDYIDKAIAERKNILVIGGTGTGKTTFLNAVLDAIAKISKAHRIITLEDLPELQCSAEDYSPMFTMQETNGEKKIVYDMTMLLKDCMRRSPDRIVVGEVRDGAAYTMLKAWNTGHPGGACTVHADNAESGLLRIESLALEDSTAPTNIGVLRTLIGQAINVAISIGHKFENVLDENGNQRYDTYGNPMVTKTREVKEMIEIHGYDGLKDRYIIKRVNRDGSVSVPERENMGGNLL